MAKPIDNSWTYADADVIHLTLTGVDAGRPLCDCDREEAVRLHRGYFVHAMYAPPFVMVDQRLCTACKAMWEDDSEDAS